METSHVNLVGVVTCYAILTSTTCCRRDVSPQLSPSFFPCPVPVVCSDGRCPTADCSSHTPRKNESHSVASIRRITIKLCVSRETTPAVDRACGPAVRVSLWTADWRDCADAGRQRRRRLNSTQPRHPITAPSHCHHRNANGTQQV